MAISGGGKITGILPLKESLFLEISWIKDFDFKDGFQCKEGKGGEYTY